MIFNTFAYRSTGLLLTILSVISLIVAFNSPLITVDISVPNTGKIGDLISLNEELCQKLKLNAFAGLIKDACDEFLLSSVNSLTNSALDLTMGPVKPYQNWSECRQASIDNIVPLFNGAAVPTGSLERCMKLSLSGLLGLDIGEQSLKSIGLQLYRADETVLLFSLLIFAVAFPVAKTGACLIGFSIWSNAKRYQIFGNAMTLLIMISKWSMLDVFVVAVLIATMKLSAFNLQITSELGLFALMVSTLSSSMALVLLSRFLMQKEVSIAESS